MSNVKTRTQNPKTDLKIRCYYFSLRIIKLLSVFPETRVYWVIGDQLLRATTSIGANIVEAKASPSKKDFLKFYQIALKSANESKYWLGLLRDGTEMNKNTINVLLKELEEISNMLGSSILTMKNKKF